MYVDHAGNPGDHDHGVGVDGDDSGIVECVLLWVCHAERVSKVKYKVKFFGISEYEIVVLHYLSVSQPFPTLLKGHPPIPDDRVQLQDILSLLTPKL